MTTEQDTEDTLLDPPMFDPNVAFTEADEPDEANPWDEEVFDEQEPAQEQEPSESRIAEEPEGFPEEYRDDFVALSQGRRLTDEVHWLGHRYVIQTLNVGEILDVGMVHKRYQQTLGDVKAYQTAVLAACTVSVDGEPLPIPPSVKAGPNEIDPVLLDRFHHLRTWLPFTIDAIYERYMLLDERVQRVIEAMGNRSG